MLTYNEKTDIHNLFIVCFFFEAKKSGREEIYCSGINWYYNEWKLQRKFKPFKILKNCL